ncbi:MAG: hypothetical protein HEQ32_05920 [Vampirovibrio sp.]|jgi:hypothetical protein
MGLAATSARKYMLMAQKMNIEFDLQQIAQSRMRILGILDRVYSATRNLDPSSAIVQQQEQFMNRMQIQDKRIALMQTRMQQQRDSIKAEMSSLDELIKEGIKQTFSYIGGGVA